MSSVTSSIFAVLRVDAIDRFLDLQLPLVPLVVHHAAVAGVGEPDAAVGMDDGVVGRVQRLAVPLVREHGDAARRARSARRAGCRARRRSAGPRSRRCCRCCCRRDCGRRSRGRRRRASGAARRWGCRSRAGSGRPRSRPGPPPRACRCGGAGSAVLPSLYLIEPLVERDDVGVRVSRRARWPRPVALVAAGHRGRGARGGGGGGEERAAVVLPMADRHRFLRVLGKTRRSISENRLSARRERAGGPPRRA